MARRSIIKIEGGNDMNGFALLWSKILDSSLWIQGSKETRLVWVALLAMKDSKGIVQASVVGLADRSKVTIEECREALNVLLSPDPEDTSKVEDGRRIREVFGGWQIVNHDMYRFSTEARRAVWREAKANQRAMKAGRTLPHPRTRQITEEELAAHAGVQKSVRHLDHVQRQAEQDSE